MSPDPASVENLALRYASAYAEKGFNVFPCRQMDKRPATVNGFHDATTNPQLVRTWFANDRGYNVAVATGLQPNECNLYAVDVDPKNGGDVTWLALVDQYGLPPTGPVHGTRSGGEHFFFDAPFELPNTSGRLGRGIDTRGVGGYVVVPPSKVIDHETGEIGFYTSTRTTSLLMEPVPPMPEWMVGLLTAEAVAEKAARHPSVGLGGPGPFDRVRGGWVWEDELLRDGWVVARRAGGVVYFTRPGKNPREGHSAVLHPGGAFVVFTESRPAGGGALRAGPGASFSPGEYVLAYRFGGDMRALMRAFPAAEAGADGSRLGLSTGPRAVEPAPGGDATPPPLFLPAEWYDQRPWMAACRQMAQAVGGSPSAHLLAFMARWATLIPPGYSIPPINGAPSSFDLLGVIAGTSGSGKTSPMRNAKELLPIGRKDIHDGLGIGSGEGIIEAFYAVVEIVGDDGKKRRERRKAIAGVNFSVSEGLIFAELAGRGGTTHVTRLCDAWSGAALSTANASAETFRHIDVNQYRLTLVMGIQADMAHELMNDSSASQGFVGRLLFAWAEEPRVSPRPRPPERPDLPVPQTFSVPATAEAPTLYNQTYLTYPDEVYAEIQAASDQRVGTNVPVEDHHHDLLRCKVAGIVALMDGRRDVSMDDWAIATDLVSVSANIRSHLYEHRRRAQKDTRHMAAVARAEVEMTVDDIKDRQAIARLAETIKGAAPMSRGKLSRATTSSKTRHRFEPALALAVSNGWVTVVGDQIEPNQR